MQKKIVQAFSLLILILLSLIGFLSNIALERYKEGIVWLALMVVFTFLLGIIYTKNDD